MPSKTCSRHFFPGRPEALNYDPIDGTDAQVAHALERVNTFSLLAGTKVVGLLDLTVFYSRVDPADFLKKNPRIPPAR